MNPWKTQMSCCTCRYLPLPNVPGVRCICFCHDKKKKGAK